MRRRNNQPHRSNVMKVWEESSRESRLNQIARLTSSFSIPVPPPLLHCPSPPLSSYHRSVYGWKPAESRACSLSRSVDLSLLVIHSSSTTEQASGKNSASPRRYEPALKTHRSAATDTILTDTRADDARSTKTTSKSVTWCPKAQVRLYVPYDWEYKEPSRNIHDYYYSNDVTTSSTTSTTTTASTTCTGDDEIDTEDYLDSEIVHIQQNTPAEDILLRPKTPERTTLEIDQLEPIDTSETEPTVVKSPWNNHENTKLTADYSQANFISTTNEGYCHKLPALQLNRHISDSQIDREGGGKERGISNSKRGRGSLRRRTLTLPRINPQMTPDTRDSSI